MGQKTGAADIHLHTCHSDGQPTVRELLDHVVARTTLDVIAITDHDTIAGALEAQELVRRHGYAVEVITGEEVSTRDGHLVGLFLHECVPAGMSARDTVAAIHAQGGLAFAPHPFFRAHQEEGKPTMMVGLGALVADLDLDGIETINATPFLGPANRRAHHYNKMVMRLPALGNSDGHILRAVGKGYTAFPGKTARHLYQAIRAGDTAAYSRSYSVPELWAYLQFWLRHMAGKSVRQNLNLPVTEY
jgi:predicted metal-dependent phosphoesterase TrpH